MLAKKLRISMLIGLLLGLSFLAGAYWVRAEIWPYRRVSEYLSRFENYAKLSHTRQWSIQTDLVALDLKAFPLASTMGARPSGGGIDTFDHKILVMDFRGGFFTYENVGGTPKITRLDITIDNGYDGFEAYMAKYNPAVVDVVDMFRFMDVMYDRESSPPRLLVTHHQWHEDRTCYSMQLSELRLDPALPIESQKAVTKDWKTVYETKPCLNVDPKVPYFTGDQSGGRVVRYAPGQVLFSVGDHAFDGWTSPISLPQAQDNDYGKILLVDTAAGTARHFSIGHRNPQGLLVDGQGRVWETEHGPRGGDELNLVRDGGNYGWPRVTFGAQYGMSRWPLSHTQNRHDGYTRPQYSWLPSVGISNLIQVHGFQPTWDGDLLVASLKGSTLHRLRYEEDRVMFDEPIVIGSRIRDLAQLDAQTVVLWTNDAEIIEVRPGVSAEPDIGEVVSVLPEDKRQQAQSLLGVCLQCHPATPHAKYGMGPNLWGVVGRRMASTDFPGYSSGLRSRSGKWDAESLNKFLKDVNKFTGGSTMGFAGIEDDETRAVVIDYLTRLQ